MSRRRLLVFVFVCFLLIWWFGRPVRTLLTRFDHIERLENEVAALEQEKAALQEKVLFYQTPAFVEQEARNRLNMSKEGETVLIFPPQSTESAASGGESTFEILPVWRQWVVYITELFRKVDYGI